MYKERAVIGLMPLYDDEKQSYWMLPGYMDVLQREGGIPMMLPLTTDETELDYFLESCDGFVLTGGHDVSPSMYLQTPLPVCGITSPLRDQMDAYILKGAVERDKAVLGICRGLQLMNAAYGGTLYQDIPTQCPSEVDHHMAAPYDRGAHIVYLRAGSPLQQLLETDFCSVNSCHHQGICELAPAFSAMAKAPDGMVEAIYMPDKRFVWGVQWHPEFFYLNSAENCAIVRAFVDAAKG